jgi:sirohydrochlorin ferrochelatase
VTTGGIGRRCEAAPALVAVAHGTRHPAGPGTVEDLLHAVRRRLPGVEVVGSYVELVEPSSTQTLARLRRPAVVVPLLLSTGHHVRADLPAAAAAASVPVALAEPLGPSGSLTQALLDRVRQAGADDADPVVLGAAGSSDPNAAAAVRRAAGLLARARAGPVTHGFASMAAPNVRTVLDRALARGGRPVTLAPYLLAPGRFADDLARVARTRARVRTAEVLGAHPSVVDQVVRRYREHAGVPPAAFSQAG